MVATHGERAQDAERCGGGSGIAGTIGQIGPSGGVCDLALPLVEVITVGGGWIADGYIERHGGSCCDRTIGGLSGESGDGFVDAERCSGAGGGASAVGHDAKKLVLVHGGRGGDGERGGGGADIARAVGQKVPRAGVGGLPKPLIGERGGRARSNRTEGGAAACDDGLVDWLDGDGGCCDWALDFDGEMAKGIFTACIDGFECEEMHTVRQADDLHTVTADGTAGRGRDDSDGGRGAVGIAGGEIDRGTAVGRDDVAVCDGYGRRAVSVEVGEQGVDAGAITGVAEKGRLKAVGGGIDGVSAAEVVDGFFDVLIDGVDLGEIAGDVDETEVEVFW